MVRPLGGGFRISFPARMAARTDQPLRATHPRRAVQMALTAWPSLSSREIAERCGVNVTMVTRNREELQSNTSDRVIGADGKAYPAKRPTAPPADDPDTHPPRHRPRVCRVGGFHAFGKRAAGKTSVAGVLARVVGGINFRFFNVAPCGEARKPRGETTRPPPVVENARCAQPRRAGVYLIGALDPLRACGVRSPKRSLAR